MKCYCKCFFCVLLVWVISYCLPARSFALGFTSVGYKSIVIPTEGDSKYLEAHLWYPTDEDARFQSMTKEGKKFFVSKNAKPIQESLQLILISTPSFTDAAGFASLSYTLAQKGFMVVALTHTGDSKNDMTYTMTPHVFELRASQIKQTIQYLLKMKEFEIIEDEVSVISFTETAFAPLLLNGFSLSPDHFTNYCKNYPDDLFCKEPFRSTMNKLSVDIRELDEITVEAEKLYKEEHDLIVSKNHDLYSEWQKEAKKAERQKKDIPVEPSYYDIPQMSARTDLIHPYVNIAKFFFVEPTLTFLFNRGQVVNHSVHIYAFYAEDSYFSVDEGQYSYLNSIFPSNFGKHILEAVSVFALSDECIPPSMSTLTELCLDISEAERMRCVQVFAGNVERLIQGDVY